MREMVRVLRGRYPVVGDATVTAAIGAVSLATDVAFYAFLTRVLGIWYLAANVVSFLCIGTANFLLNRRFTYGHRGAPAPRQVAQFFTVATVGVVLNTAILAAAVDLFRINDLIGKLFAAGVVFLWNFSANRLWTFRHRGRL